MDTMTENDYLHAWAIYAVAAVGCLLVWFRITRWMWRWLREPLRVLAVVALAVPTVIDPTQDKYAPAVAVTALDLVFKVGNNAWRTLSELLMYAMIALVVYAVFVLVRWPFLRRAEERRAALAEAEASAQAQPAVAAEPTFGAAGQPRYSADVGASARIDPRL
jgi:branched-subunit amino acid ABC-type transport system permease component